MSNSCVLPVFFYFIHINVCLLFLAITCAGLDSPRHGYKSSCLTNSFGEKCLFYCNIGYEAINGSTSRTCLENATWSGTPLFCKGLYLLCYSLKKRILLELCLEFFGNLRFWTFPKIV